MSPPYGERLLGPGGTTPSDLAGPHQSGVANHAVGSRYTFEPEFLLRPVWPLYPNTFSTQFATDNVS
jgi:hypothetical protein